MATTYSWVLAHPSLASNRYCAIHGTELPEPDLSPGSLEPVLWDGRTHRRVCCASEHCPRLVALAGRRDTSHRVEPAGFQIYICTTDQYEIETVDVDSSPVDVETVDISDFG